MTWRDDQAKADDAMKRETEAGRTYRGDPIAKAERRAKKESSAVLDRFFELFGPRPRRR